MVEGGWDGGTGGTKREAKGMEIEQYQTLETMSGACDALMRQKPSLNSKVYSKY